MAFVSFRSVWSQCKQFCVPFMTYVTDQCLAFSGIEQVCLATILRMCIREFQTKIPAIFMTITQHGKFSHLFDKICGTSRSLLQQNNSRWVKKWEKRSCDMHSSLFSNSICTQNNKLITQFATMTLFKRLHFYWDKPSHSYVIPGLPLPVLTTSNNETNFWNVHGATNMVVRDASFLNPAW